MRGTTEEKARKKLCATGEDDHGQQDFFACPECRRDFPRPFQIISTLGQEGRGHAECLRKEQGKALKVMRNILKDLELAGCEAVQMSSPSARMWRQHCARCQEPKYTVLEFRGVKSRLRDEGIGEIKGMFRRTLSGGRKSLNRQRCISGESYVGTNRESNTSDQASLTCGSAEAERDNAALPLT